MTLLFLQVTLELFVKPMKRLHVIKYVGAIFSKQAQVTVNFLCKGRLQSIGPEGEKWNKMLFIITVCFR